MNRLIKLLLIIFFNIAFLQINIAQNSGIRTVKKESGKELNSHNGKFRIGITPSALLNTYSGLQGNMAYNISYRLQFNLEAGWIFYSTAFNSSPISGYRIRPAIRWYVNDSDTEDSEYRFHLSLGYNIRNTIAQRTGNFSLSGGSFANNIAYEQERTVTGLAVLFGTDVWLNNRTILDMGLGFGLGKINIADINTPNNSSKVISDLISSDRPGKNLFPILILNIRFQYSL